MQGCEQPDTRMSIAEQIEFLLYGNCPYMLPFLSLLKLNNVFFEIHIFLFLVDSNSNSIVQSACFSLSRYVGDIRKVTTPTWSTSCHRRRITRSMQQFRYSSSLPCLLSSPSCIFLHASLFCFIFLLSPSLFSF